MRMPTSMTGLKRRDPEPTNKNYMNGRTVNLIEKRYAVDAFAAVSAAGLSGGDLACIILEGSNSEGAFRMGATVVVTIQGYRGTDGSQK
jgi:hypothetical protein